MSKTTPVDQAVNSILAKLYGDAECIAAHRFDVPDLRASAYERSYPPKRKTGSGPLRKRRTSEGGKTDGGSGSVANVAAFDKHHGAHRATDSLPMQARSSKAQRSEGGQQ